MPWPSPVLWPSATSLEPLLSQPGVAHWVLEEEFRPHSASMALGSPAKAFTPAGISRLRHWLIEAPASAGVSLQAGLLAWQGQWLYEGAPASSKINRPPGWWQRQRQPKLDSRPLVLLGTHSNPNYFPWATLPGMASLILQDHFQLEAMQNSALALSTRPGRPLPGFVEQLCALGATESPSVMGSYLASRQRCRFALQQHETDVVMSPAAIQWWRCKLASHLAPCLRPWRRLWISRNKGRQRCCVNERAIQGVLQPLGFEPVVLETLSVLEQLQLFSEAEVVAGVHGAGFTNLLACTQGTRVLEVLPDDGPYNHYFLISQGLGLHHGHLIAKAIGAAGEGLWIDPDGLLAMLHRFLHGNSVEFQQ